MNKKHQRKAKNTICHQSKKCKHTFYPHEIFSTRRNFYFFVAALVMIFTASVTVASFQIQHTAAQVPESFKSISQERLEKVVIDMTKGYPIEEMLPYIFKQDKLTVAYLVSIAKKESNWGKRVPRKDDTDCYNYWGYKGAGERGIAQGHGCFGSPEEAVETVAVRINTLTKDYELKTPRQMVVWKCGFSCDGHSDISVQKWINDVAYYADEIKESNAKTP